METASPIDFSSRKISSRFSSLLTHNTSQYLYLLPFVLFPPFRVVRRQEFLPVLHRTSHSLTIFPSVSNMASEQALFCEIIQALQANNHSDAQTLFTRYLGQGYNVNAQYYDRTLLMDACFFNHLPLVQQLLDHGSDPEIRHPITLQTALMMACQSIFINTYTNQIVKLLLERDTSPNAVDIYGWNAAIHIIRSSIPYNHYHYQILKRLLGKSSPIEYSNVQLFLTPTTPKAYDVLTPHQQQYYFYSMQHMIKHHDIETRTAPHPQESSEQQANHDVSESQSSFPPYDPSLSNNLFPTPIFSHCDQRPVLLLNPSPITSLPTQSAGAGSSSYTASKSELSPAHPLSTPLSLASLAANLGCPSILPGQQQRLTGADMEHILRSTPLLGLTTTVPFDPSLRSHLVRSIPANPSIYSQIYRYLYPVDPLTPQQHKILTYYFNSTNMVVLLLFQTQQQYSSSFQKILSYLLSRKVDLLAMFQFTSPFTNITTQTSTIPFIFQYCNVTYPLVKSFATHFSQHQVSVTYPQMVNRGFSTPARYNPMKFPLHTSKDTRTSLLAMLLSSTTHVNQHIFDIIRFCFEEDLSSPISFPYRLHAVLTLLSRRPQRFTQHLCNILELVLYNVTLPPTRHHGKHASGPQTVTNYFVDYQRQYRRRVDYEMKLLEERHEQQQQQHQHHEDGALDSSTSDHHSVHSNTSGNREHSAADSSPSTSRLDLLRENSDSTLSFRSVSRSTSTLSYTPSPNTVSSMAAIPYLNYYTQIGDVLYPQDIPMDIHTTDDMSRLTTAATQCLIAALESGYPSLDLILYLISRKALCTNWNLLDIGHWSSYNPLCLLFRHYISPPIDVDDYLENLQSTPVPPVGTGRSRRSSSSAADITAETITPGSTPVLSAKQSPHELDHPFLDGSDMLNGGDGEHSSAVTADTMASPLGITAPTTTLESPRLPASPESLPTRQSLTLDCAQSVSAAIITGQEPAQTSSTPPTNPFIYPLITPNQLPPDIMTAALHVDFLTLTLAPMMKKMQHCQQEGGVSLSPEDVNDGMGQHQPPKPSSTTLQSVLDVSLPNHHDYDFSTTDEDSDDHLQFGAPLEDSHLPSTQSIYSLSSSLKNQPDELISRETMILSSILPRWLNPSQDPTTTTTTTAGTAGHSSDSDTSPSPSSSSSTPVPTTFSLDSYHQCVPRNNHSIDYHLLDLVSLFICQGVDVTSTDESGLRCVWHLLSNPSIPPAVIPYIIHLFYQNGYNDEMLLADCFIWLKTVIFDHSTDVRSSHQSYAGLLAILNILSCRGVDITQTFKAFTQQVEQKLLTPATVRRSIRAQSSTRKKTTSTTSTGLSQYDQLFPNTPALAAFHHPQFKTSYDYHGSLFHYFLLYGSYHAYLASELYDYFNCAGLTVMSEAKGMQNTTLFDYIYYLFQYGYGSFATRFGILLYQELLEVLMYQLGSAYIFTSSQHELLLARTFCSPTRSAQDLLTASDDKDGYNPFTFTVAYGQGNGGRDYNRLTPATQRYELPVMHFISMIVQLYLSFFHDYDYNWVNTLQCPDQHDIPTILSSARSHSNSINETPFSPAGSDHHHHHSANGHEHSQQRSSGSIQPFTSSAVAVDDDDVVSSDSNSADRKSNQHMHTTRLNPRQSLVTMISTTTPASVVNAGATLHQHDSSSSDNSGSGGTTTPHRGNRSQGQPSKKNALQSISSLLSSSTLGQITSRSIKPSSSQAESGTSSTLTIDISHLIHTDTPYHHYTVEIITNLLPFITDYNLICCAYHQSNSTCPLLTALLESVDYQVVTEPFVDMFHAFVDLYRSKAVFDPVSFHQAQFSIQQQQQQQKQQHQQRSRAQSTPSTKTSSQPLGTISTKLVYQTTTFADSPLIAFLKHSSRLTSWSVQISELLLTLGFADVNAIDSTLDNQNVLYSLLLRLQTETCSPHHVKLLSIFVKHKIKLILLDSHDKSLIHALLSINTPYTPSTLQCLEVIFNNLKLDPIVTSIFHSVFIRKLLPSLLQNSTPSLRSPSTVGVALDGNTAVGAHGSSLPLMDSISISLETTSSSQHGSKTKQQQRQKKLITTPPQIILLALQHLHVAYMYYYRPQPLTIYHYDIVDGLIRHGIDLHGCADGRTDPNTFLRYFVNHPDPLGYHGRRTLLLLLQHGGWLYTSNELVTSLQAQSLWNPISKQYLTDSLQITQLLSGDPIKSSSVESNSASYRPSLRERITAKLGISSSSNRDNSKILYECKNYPRLTPSLPKEYLSKFPLRFARIDESDQYMATIAFYHEFQLQCNNTYQSVTHALACHPSEDVRLLLFGRTTFCEGEMKCYQIQPLESLLTNREWQLNIRNKDPSLPQQSSMIGYTPVTVQTNLSSASSMMIDDGDGSHDNTGSTTHGAGQSQSTSTDIQINVSFIDFSHVDSIANINKDTTMVEDNSGLLWYILNNCNPMLDDISLFLFECVNNPTLRADRVNGRNETTLMHAILRRWPQDGLFQLLNLLGIEKMIAHRDFDNRTIADYIHACQTRLHAPQFVDFIEDYIANKEKQ